MGIVKFNFQSHGDDRGQLIALESFKEIPFEIKRVYYIYDTKDKVRRGFHAHKNLEQILICVSGSCKLHLDNGQDTEEVLLDTPEKGLYISSGIWREMYDFSPDAVLLVLASEHYAESDYIRNYNEFIKYIGEKSNDKNKSAVR